MFCDVGVTGEQKMFITDLFSVSPAQQTLGGLALIGRREHDPLEASLMFLSRVSVLFF